MKVAEYLEQHGVQFEVLPHLPAYDAQRMAQSLHVAGHEVAKTVLLRADSGHVYVVAVLPADRQIDMRRAAAALGDSRLELASEVEIQQHCPDCETGVLPPFGSAYGMKTMLDESLVHDAQMVFEGNTHNQAIRIRVEDFRRLEEPLLARFSVQLQGA